MRTNAGEFNIGVDIGGTKIALGLTNTKGEVLFRKKYPTEAEKGFKTVVDGLIFNIHELIRKNGVCKEEINSIGIGVPGTVDLNTGEVVLAPNLQWKDVPLVPVMRNAFPGIFICADRDTAVTAWGEFLGCNDNSINNLFFLTISTGIGSGLVINRHLYRGSYHMSGEIGHTVVVKDGIQCTCGNRGCLERYANGPSIVMEAERRIRCGEYSMLSDILDREEHLNNKHIDEAAALGDGLAHSVILQVACHVGYALANVINLISPDLIVIGGGVARCGSLLFDPLVEVILSSCYPPSRDKVRIETTKLWEDAAIIGASFIYKTLEKIDL